MVQFPQDFIKPLLHVPEIDHYTFPVQSRSSDGSFHREIMAVQLFAFSANLLQHVGGGKIPFNYDLIHGGVYIQEVRILQMIEQGGIMARKGISSGLIPLRFYFLQVLQLGRALERRLSASSTASRRSCSATSASILK